MRMIDCRNVGQRPDAQLLGTVACVQAANGTCQVTRNGLQPVMLLVEALIHLWWPSILSDQP